MLLSAPLILASSLAFSTCADGDPAAVRELLDAIESIQKPVEDFRCEYEGRIYVKEKGPGGPQGLNDDGLYDEFSGVFVWRRGGDTYDDCMHRIVPQYQITRDTLAIRRWANQAERLVRPYDTSVGHATIDLPDRLHTARTGNLGEIFLIDELKRLAADPNMECSVAAEQVEGRSLKVLDAGLKGVPGSRLFRFWIDLERGGHVVRKDFYLSPKEVGGRLDIRLTEFKIGDAKVWMPTHGEMSNYAKEKGGKPVVSSTPTTTETIYVNGGSMEFNKKPGNEVFEVKYKAGTPVSDNLRKLQFEYGQQKPGVRKSKAETEAELRAQVDEAQKQGKELLASSPARDRDWTPWFVGLFGTVALVTSITLWVQRRRH